MARSARIAVPHVAHHVTQRGNRRQDVFFTTDDRRTYLTLLRARGEAAGVRVLGYCLMTHHVHLLLVPAAGSPAGWRRWKPAWVGGCGPTRLAGRGRWLRSGPTGENAGGRAREWVPVPNAKR